MAAAVVYGRGGAGGGGRSDGLSHHAAQFLLMLLPLVPSLLLLTVASIQVYSSGLKEAGTGLQIFGDWVWFGCFCGHGCTTKGSMMFQLRGTTCHKFG